MRDALVAAFPAGDGSASTKWITLTSYGAGANPIIDASGLNAAVDFPSTYTGGWKIKNLETKNAIVAGIHCDATTANGLWVESCNIHDLDPTSSMPLPPGGSDNTPRVSGFHNAWPTGVEVSGVTAFYMSSVTMQNTGAPLMLWGLDKFLVTGCTMDTSKYQSFWLLNLTTSGFITNGTIVNTRITNLGTLGWPNGTAGVAVSRADTIIFDTCQIDSMTHADSDAESIDFEGTCTAILVLNCNLHDDYGAPTKVTLGGVDGLIFSGNTFTNNGTGDPTKKPCLMRQNVIPTYQFWQGNTTTRAGTGTTQKLFADAASPTPGYFSDTPQTNVYYGPDNTVTP